MDVGRNFPILIVDGQMTMLRIERNLLMQIGLTNVDLAQGGTEAFRRAKEKAYSLIISDWNMSPMTGLELLRRVRADKSLKATPFIIVTTESKPETLDLAKQAGVSNHIVKPFNSGTLKEKITAVLGHF